MSTEGGFLLHQLPINKMPYRHVRGHCDGGNSLTDILSSQLFQADNQV